MKRSIIVFCFMAYGLFPIIAQKAETAEARQYLEVLKKRSEKILDQYVEIPVGEQREKVRDLMVRQYWDLNKVHDTKNTKIEGLKKSGLPAGKFEKKKNGVEKKAEKKLLKLQKRYIKNLSKYLNEEQIDGIKEGMTLGAMAHNYRGFTEMIPTLTSEEKEYIRQQLLDARNKAMNMGSSEEKQAIFRQYKGKINNYLSEEKGYDLKKEGELWQERIKKTHSK